MEEQYGVKTFDDSDQEDEHLPTDFRGSSWQWQNPRLEERSIIHSAYMEDDK